MSKIIIIDDVIDSINITKAHLEKDGHQVLVAEGGLVGIKRIVEFTPDLILIDVMMPNIDGLEILHALKNNSITKNTPVIMQSSDGNNSSVIEALDMGAHDFIVKGSKYPVLSARIRSALKLKKSQELLETANHNLINATEAKSDFLSKMSHEIRTSLTGIIGMSQLLSDQLTDEASIRYNDISLSSANALHGLLDNILDISKIESGKMNIEEVYFDLAIIALEAINIFTVKAAEKNIELILDISPRLANQYLGDPTRVRQILINYIANAIKFTNEGSITLSIDVNDTQGEFEDIILSVSDTGIGISEEGISKIFQPFSQATDDTCRKYGGTGLGLSICELLSKLMGGLASVESTINSGTTFYSTLPMKCLNTNNNLSVNTTFTKNKTISLAISCNKLYESISKTINYWGMNIVKTDFENIPDKLSVDIIILDKHTLLNNKNSIVDTITNNKNTKFLIFTSDIGISFLPELDNITSLHHPLYSRSLLAKLHDIFDYETTNKLSNTKHLDHNKTTKALNILVAEDNKVNQIVICKTLEKMGHTCTIACNGAKALDNFMLNSENNDHFDLILMDYEMPVLNGLESTIKIRQWEATKEQKKCPIFALTAHTTKDNLERCMKSGMNGSITKPININYLNNILMSI